MFGHGSEKIVFASVEEGDVRSGTRRYDTYHLAAHELFARTGQFHLIADGDLEARADQARDIAFGGVIRNAAHGNGLALFAVARGESDLQLARGDDRVFIEKFIEIPKTKKQQGVRVARLDSVILLDQRCCRLAHSRVTLLCVLRGLCGFCVNSFSFLSVSALDLVIPRCPDASRKTHNPAQSRANSHSGRRRRHVPHPCWFSAAADSNRFSACAFSQHISRVPSTSPGCRSAPSLPVSQDKPSAPGWCRDNTTSCRNNLLRPADCPILRIRRRSAGETRQAWCSKRRRRARGDRKSTRLNSSH